jgi:glycosyltransferase involved in cell wall biosynthesis
VKIAIMDELPIHDAHIQRLKKENIHSIFLRGNIYQKIMSLRRFFRENHVDLILSYLPKDISMAGIAGRGLVKYHVGGIRNAQMHPLKIRALKYLHNNWLYSSISNCISGKEFFSLKGFKEEKIAVIPNGIEIPMAMFHRKPSDQIVITTMGRLVAQKDFETAIKSMAYLRAGDSAATFPVHLKIVGEGPDWKKLSALIEKLNLTQHISLIADARDTATILLESDIYLCTSVYEGVSNAIMEAMSYALPIVATNVGDNGLLVRDQISGYLLPAGDYVGIGNALKRLLESYDGQQGYRLLCNNYHIDLFKTRYLDYINSIK